LPAAFFPFGGNRPYTKIGSCWVALVSLFFLGMLADDSPNYFYFYLFRFPTGNN
jgi:hypothetical protein